MNIYAISNMTLNKFGVHISKSNVTDLENSIVSKIQNKILQNLKTDARYTENEIIKSSNISSLRIRVNDNNENLQNIVKKIKLIETDFLPDYDNKISDIKNNFNEKLANYEVIITTLKKELKFASILKYEEDIKAL